MTFVEYSILIEYSLLHVDAPTNLSESYLAFVDSSIVYLKVVLQSPRPERRLVRDIVWGMTSKLKADLNID